MVGECLQPRQNSNYYISRWTDLSPTRALAVNSPRRWQQKLSILDILNAVCHLQCPLDVDCAVTLPAMVSTPQTDKHILWHPRRHNKFVVGGGSQLSMYEWASELSEIRHLSSQGDLSFMKVNSHHLKLTASLHDLSSVLLGPLIRLSMISSRSDWYPDASSSSD